MSTPDDARRAIQSERDILLNLERRAAKRCKNDAADEFSDRAAALTVALEQFDAILADARRVQELERERSDAIIVGWMVGPDPRSAAMYNASGYEKAMDAALRWQCGWTALVVHPAAPAPSGDPHTLAGNPMAQEILRSGVRTGPSDERLNRALGPAPSGGTERVPYPEFCRHPERCAGLGSCPRDPTCAD